MCGPRARVASGRLPARYVELRIEQGPVLLGAELPLAVVTGITGSRAARSSRTDTRATRNDADGRPRRRARRRRRADTPGLDAASDIEDAVATVGGSRSSRVR